MKKTVIVTDSTADIPDKMLEEYGIYTVPLYIHAEGKEYKDKIDISNSEIYSMLERGLKVKTSAPSPKDFLELYKKVLEDDSGADIISIHISSKLSNTIDSANLAKSKLLSNVIEIFDSRTVSMSLGLVVLMAARWAKKGLEFETIQKKVQDLIEKTKFFATVENFEYLLKGGRVSGLKKLLNFALKVKPVFITDEGKVKVSKMTRTRNSSIEKIVSEFVLAFSGKKVIASIFYGDDLDAAKQLKQSISERPEVQIEEMIFTEITPVIGTHSGPSIIGISAIPVES